MKVVSVRRENTRSDPKNNTALSLENSFWRIRNTVAIMSTLHTAQYLRNFETEKEFRYLEATDCLPPSQL
ncbi:hypothetical protein JTB14_018344 [Gonioctena quinquepunctata]|nr:hypothetical protein JTB14_018344 [Gonioctena quinquepunctata]